MSDDGLAPPDAGSRSGSRKRAHDGDRDRGPTAADSAAVAVTKPFFRLRNRCRRRACGGSRMRLAIAALWTAAAANVGEGVYFALQYSQDFQWSPDGAAQRGA